MPTNSIQEGDDLLTTGEVARLLRIHPVTLARWVREGKIEAHSLTGRTRRFRASDIASFVAANGGKESRDGGA